ncbi:patatin-like phospholipase family protein [Epilithonimonas lactis]|uniref:PNPLA domain-containing protein n=1 Tax=Epilithonimonas lactis TaxID=421072 RepID=A0A085BJ72_9FLAO|nr:patatin-like phospholipase family protein [Epilithonimonas lactis]KFC22517.1 hypothetical protein IO89_05505 [Epilithonimonas lactis]SEQ79165.1 Patatin-like phospholipase [Epilithonimonas lactis]
MENLSIEIKGEKIHIGLVLAGAVTAGAYTAGVLDYLFSTLLLWEEKHKEDPVNVPKPNVVIDIFTGASAGSIAAAVSLIGLAKGALKEVTDPYSAEARDNILFDTWVNFGLNDSEDISQYLLSAGDLENGKLESLLNVQFMDQLIDKIVLKSQSIEINVLPDFINPNLDVLLTLSNLKGIPIDLYYDSDNNKVAHTMSYHKGFAYFQNNKQDSDTSKLNLDLNDEDSIRFFLKCARASGAFPLGLKSVSFEKIPKDYIIGNLKRIFGNEFKFVPRIDDFYNFTAVDGGLTNNEPIAEALRVIGKEFNKNYKMIMVDPFPSYILPKGLEKKEADDDLFKTIPKLVSTLRQQASFKENDITDMFDDSTDKNMIWPTRYNEKKELLPNTIACGALSGFAGFINKDFRVHDYMLGRKNCQSFLRYYFHLEAELHPSISEWSEPLKEKYAFSDNKTNKTMIPIIPDFRIESKQIMDRNTRFYPYINESNTKGLTFPSIDYQKDLVPLEKILNKRLKSIVDITYDHLRKKEDNATIPIIKKRNELVFIKDFKVRVWKFLGYTFMRSVGNRFIATTLSNKIINIIIEELFKYKLLK